MKTIGLNNGKFAMVDDEDYIFLSQWKWQAKKHRNTYYAVRTIHVKRKSVGVIWMHRVINKTPTGLVTDHIDRNGLNNQKSNLRTSSISENNRNSMYKNGTSKYKGVGFKGNKWRARISVNKKQIHLGVFKSQEDAAIAYNNAAIKYHGEFAYLNEIKV